LFSSYGFHSDAEDEDQAGGIALKVDLDDIFLSVDAAIPCGLLINELVSNSLKHAFSPGKKGEIRIGFHVAASPEGTSGKHCGDSADNNNHLTLSISDDGIGFPENLDFKNTESLGLQIVTALTNQLEGTIELNRNKGTGFEIKFCQNLISN
jgi:two-component sensor histidine kinase